jgi:hypothetical protein
MNIIVDLMIHCMADLLSKFMSTAHNSYAYENLLGHGL